MTGALVVDKPAGPTSHDVVARVRRAIRITRIGHTGTLDPLATGVLPLLVGRATRLAQFLASDEKEYVAAIRLGQATPTYDAEERIVRAPDGTLALGQPVPLPSAMSEADLLAALAGFKGTMWQVPPPFSAKKIGGTPAHRLARRQDPVDIRPAQVTVRELELLAYDGGLATVRLACSSGFYVRSLAHDLGQRLGCGAHLEGLQRTRAGDFRLAQSVPLETIEREGPGALARLVPMPALLPRLPHVVVNDRGARRASHGNALAREDLRETDPSLPAAGAGPVRVLDQEGALIAIGHVSGGGLLQPVVVLV